MPPAPPIEDNGDPTDEPNQGPTTHHAEADQLAQDVGPHPIREQILAALEATPGMNLAQIQDALGIDFPTAHFHLNQLTLADQVVSYESPRTTDYAYFRAKDASAWNNPRTRPLFGRETLRRPALYVAENPGCTSEDIANAFDVSRPVAQGWLRELSELKLLVSNQVNRRVTYHPLSELKAWAQGIGARFERPWDDG